MSHRITFAYRLALSSTSLLLGAVLGCSGGSEQIRQVEPSTTELRLPAQLGALKRPAVEFNHGKHVVALEQEGCGKCHASNPQGRVQFAFKHTQGRTGRDELMNAFHDACAGCHKQRSLSRQSTGPVTCGECHVERAAGESMRVALRFDYSLHGRHSKAANDKCEACHHVYNRKTEALEYKEGAESACRDCHQEQEVGDNVSLRRASHQGCVNCHLQQAQQGSQTGPALCVGCHDESKQQAIKRMAEVPRLDRDQPDSTWVHAAGGKAPLVPFNHEQHEPLTHSCSTCHHESLKACADCHTLGGSKQGQGVTVATAYHLASSDHSCVGCHATRTQKKDCAGCHHALEPPPAERACAVCHSGPPPSAQARSIPVPQAPEVKLPALPDYSDDFPESVTIGVLASGYKASKLPHGEMVAALGKIIRHSKLASRFHGSNEILCSSCHHQAPVGSRPAPCRSCHGETAHRTQDKPALIAAYHRQCIGCHQQMQVKAVGCTDCHAAAAKEAGK